MYRTDGTGHVTGKSLPPPAPDRTDGLRAADGDRPIFPGDLVANPGVVPFQVVGEPIAPAITTEITGGAASPDDHPPVVWLDET